MQTNKSSGQYHSQTNPNIVIQLLKHFKRFIPSALQNYGYSWWSTIASLCQESKEFCSSCEQNTWLHPNLETLIILTRELTIWDFFVINFMEIIIIMTQFYPIFFLSSENFISVQLFYYRFKFFSRNFIKW